MPVETAYIDTSVLGAYYCPESLSAAAEAALRQTKIPVISLFSEVEFCSLLSRKRQLKELTERQMSAVLDPLRYPCREGVYQPRGLDQRTFPHCSQASRLSAELTAHPGRSASGRSARRESAAGDS